MMPSFSLAMTRQSQTVSVLSPAYKTRRYRDVRFLHPLLFFLPPSSLSPSFPSYRQSFLVPVFHFKLLTTNEFSRRDINLHQPKQQ